MGRAGDCNVCHHRMRSQIDEAHVGGEGTRSIARRFSIPEANARRHFARCLQVRRDAPKPATPTVTRAHLEAVAAEFGLTFEEVLRHHVLCRGGDVVTSSDEEAHELCELAGLLEDGATCCAETA